MFQGCLDGFLIQFEDESHGVNEAPIQPPTGENWHKPGALRGRKASVSGWIGGSGFMFVIGFSHPCHLEATADSYFDSVETASENLSWNSALGRT